MTGEYYKQKFGTRNHIPAVLRNHFFVVELEACSWRCKDFFSSVIVFSMVEIKRTLQKNLILDADKPRG